MPRSIAKSDVRVLDIQDHFKGEDFRDATRTIICLEDPPRRVPMNYAGEVYSIPLPWSIYVIAITGDRSNRYIMGSVRSMFGRSEAIKSKNDSLYFLPLPNFYGRSLRFCGNSTTVADTALLSQCSQIIADFWGSKFTYLRPESYKSAWNWLFSNTETDNYGYLVYKKWEKLSDEEALKFPWGKLECTTLNMLLKDKDYGSFVW